LNSNGLSIVHEAPEIRDWAAHKARDAIRCGLCQGCSGLSPDDWNQISPNTNLAEVNHEAGYHWSGRYIPTLLCIQR
jgi:hypothetical protein